MQQTFGKCPHCGKSIAVNYMLNEWKYGSPIKVCKKCNQEYIDKRYHEMAIDGLNPETFDIKASLVFLTFGITCFVASILVTIFTLWLDRSYYPMMIAIGIMGILIVIGMLCNIIAIKFGLKQRRVEKKMLQSVERLQNKEYAYKLASLGYNVPERFL